MQHFNFSNLDRICDALPNTWATVRFDDTITFSELVRHNFHLVDMTGELWTFLRAG